MVFEVDSTIMEEHTSDRVCLLFEKRHSTEILTLGIVRMSWEMRASTGKSLACF